MRETAVSFATFEKFLHNLGFTQGTVPGSHVWYEHEPSGTVIMARLHKPEDRVPWHTFVSAQQLLVERGLVSAEEFEKMERGAAA
jgi:predicted RNA binding protein YcfA (HicA-like mRNA interferase family)